MDKSASTLRILTAALWIFASAATSAHGFEIEFSAGGPGFVIRDNDGAGPNDPDDPNDLNPAPGIIDFVLDGSQVTDLWGHGRAVEDGGPIGHSLHLIGTEPAPSAVLQNVGASNLTVTVTLRSSPIANIGKPLGWRLYHIGEVADPTPATVEVTGHSATLTVNDGTLLDTISVADIVDAGDPPTPFAEVSAPGLDPAGSVTSSRVELQFTFGPGDELRVPVDASNGGTGLRGHVFNNDGRCVFLANWRLAKVAKAESTADVYCIRDRVSQGGGDATACVDEPSEKGAILAGKVVSTLISHHCFVPPPPWGVNAGTCCNGGEDHGLTCSEPFTCPDGSCDQRTCITSTVQGSINDYVRDLLGDPIVVGSDDIGACQARIIKDAVRAIDKTWQSFAKCKKRQFSSITDDATFGAVCFEPILDDPKNGFDKYEAKIAKRAVKCEATGVTPIATYFPGACATAPDAGTFAECTMARARCRFCQSVNVADDVDPAFDCDQFDDGDSNGSCANVAGPATTTTTTTLP